MKVSSRTDKYMPLPGTRNFLLRLSKAEAGIPRILSNGYLNPKSVFYGLKPHTAKHHLTMS